MSVTETKADRQADLRLGGALSLALHLGLILTIGIAVTHSRAHFTPPVVQVIHLNVDLPAPVSAENTLASPSASPVDSSVPQVSAPPRPVLAKQNEERLLPSAAPQDVAPAAPEPIAPLTMAAGSVVTGEATTKQIFGAGGEGVLKAAVAPAHAAPAVTSGSGVSIEGPISLRNGMKPLYPLGARQRGEEGTVVLETIVTPDGRATAVTVVTSSRFADLDRAAARAVERATFNPATDEGRTVEARARITIIFRLTN